MKESDQSVELRGELGKERNEATGGIQLMQRKQCIEGRGTPSDLRDIVDVFPGGSWRARCNIRPLNLDPVEEGMNSSASEMAGSEQATSSNHSYLRENTKVDYKSTVSFNFEIQNVSLNF